jgi:tRNA U34 5-carboxymethylaminomethyl modifying GTPase MnmE/TrmE
MLFVYRALTVPAHDVHIFAFHGVFAKLMNEEVDVALYQWFLFPESFITEGVGEVAAHA